MNGAARTSFVIPARNAARTLSQTLDSLLAQGDADWQALIVDDGSSDETPMLFAAYARRDARFVVLRGSGNDGASAARNIGLQQARGQRVVFLDSDDWIDPAFLQRLHAALDAVPGAAAAYCDYQRVMAGGALTPAYSEPDVAHAPFDTFARTCAVAIHTVLIEREVVARAGAFDTTLRTCEDWDLWQRVARLGTRWVHVAEPLAFYRTNETSLSRDTDQMLTDAAVVIHRGFGADPRLPDAVHAAGASRVHGMTPEIVLAYVALWCGGFEAAHGRQLPNLCARLAALPSGSEHSRALAITLVDGLTVGLRAPPRELAARWAEFGPRVTALIDALGTMWADGVAARRTQYAFERLLLQHDDLAAPRPLALTLGLRVDLRALPTVVPTDGIDRLYAYLCDSTRVLAVAEVGALGAWAPRQWIELATQHLDWKAVMRLTGPGLARSLTPKRLADAARAGCAYLRFTAIEARGWRPVTQAAAQAAWRAAAAAGSHDNELAHLREQAGCAFVTAPAAKVRSRKTSPTKESATGRHLFWDALFRQPDPWNYGSAYEQEKYAFQLELLPEGPIASALELACAEGRFTEKLAARVQHLVASDISATALARAAERCHGNPHIEFRQLDLAADALPQGVDLIVCSEVLYFLDDETALRRVAAQISAALKPGGHVVTAHALVLADDMTRTGFDWDHPWGAKTIARVFSEVLTLERSLSTELYQVDRFVRADPPPDAPRVETRPIAAEIEHDVARFVVWGGATARRTVVAHSERHQRLPVLTYHRIAEDGPLALSRYRVGARMFGEQMAWLRRNGFHAIVADELVWFLEHRQPFIGRPVMISFDDGFQDFADVAWPLLRRHDLPAEVFVVTDLVGGCADWDSGYGEPAPLMDAPTISALASQGARFGSHLASHRGADGLSTHALAEELLRSRRCIALWTGLQPCALAAPFGLVDQRLQRLAVECGYRIGFGTESAAASLADNPMRLPRIEVRGDMGLEEFGSVLEACR